MKLMDKNYKLLGKIHFFDFFLLLLALAVVVALINRFTGGEITSLVAGSDQVTLEVTAVTYPYPEEMLKNLETDEKLVENKTWMQGEITQLRWQDYEVEDLNQRGDMVTAIHPEEKQMWVTLEMVTDYKAPIYQFGQQEIRVGASYFIRTLDSEISSLIVDMKIKE